MTPAALRAVLFDAAGTLIATREPVGETYARIAGEFGLELSAWRLEEAFTRCLRSAPLLVFPNIAPDEIEARERDWWRDVVRATFRAVDTAQAVRFTHFDACFERLYGHFARPDAWCARTGAREALEALRARDLSTGVVSNFDRRLTGILAGLGLSPLLDILVLPSDAGAAKPDPAIFRCALARLGLHPPEVAYVGDDPEQDLRAARDAGLQAIDVGELATLAALPAQLDAHTVRQEAR